MPFGLRNAAQTFQKHIDEVLQGLLHCYAYIDDILIASENEEEHQEHLKQLFARLDKYATKINPTKCTLGEKTVRFLGYEVSEAEIRPLPQKVEAIRNFKRPQTIRQFIMPIPGHDKLLPKVHPRSGPRPSNIKRNDTRK